MMIKYTSKRIKSYIKTAIFSTVAIATLLPSCKSNKLSEAPRVSSFRGNTLPAPPGMVYVPSGTIHYKSSLDSSDVAKNISLSAFFIDKTEVTNSQYRQFVNWVADSIAITDYLNDDQYYLPNTSNNGATGANGERLIDWKKVKKVSPLWRSKDPSIQERLAPMITTEGDRKVLNRDVIRYTFSYRRANSESREYITLTVPVLPAEDRGWRDFPNSQMLYMQASYFERQVFDDPPVVGVTGNQARAYPD